MVTKRPRTGAEELAGTAPHPKDMLRVDNRTQWRRWLARYHRTRADVWLVFAKAKTGLRSISYAEAVEEALCFGWIDTTVRRLDERYFAQRFTPRKDRRNWSAINLERFQRMERAGLMTDAGRAMLPADHAPPAKRIQSDEPVPEYIMDAIMADEAATTHFLALAPGYRRDYVRWIDEAKKDETRRRRLQQAILKLRANVKRVQDPSGIR